MKLRAWLSCAPLLLACNTGPKLAEPDAKPAPSPAASTATSPSAAARGFGAKVASGPLTSLAEVLASPEKFADKSVLIEGEVRRACSRKGCWMELSESRDAAAPGCRVTFKDYAFFVPTDSAGSKARVEAKVESKLVKASLVQHLEEEGARFGAKEPDGSAHEVRLVASGVELWR